jgi:putative ABC transport system substrate-binding protein
LAARRLRGLSPRAQQPGMPVIGFLNGLGPNDRSNLLAAFRRGLGETGFVDGRNVAIEYRFAENHYDRLPALAADLAGRKVAVIAATGGGASILAAMAATKTVPIVFTSGGDPVQQGYVASLNRPGSKVTGVSWFNNLVAAKGLGLLHELVPNAAVVALLVNPQLPQSARMESEGREAARSLGQQLLVLHASTPNEIDTAFATMRQRRVGALLVGADPFLSNRHQQIAALAARDAIHVGRILNGASPADPRMDHYRLLIISSKGSANLMPSGQRPTKPRTGWARSASRYTHQLKLETQHAIA